MIQTVQFTPDTLVEAFFQQCQGEWRSQRRYYTLKDGETQEVISQIAIKFLPRGSADLIQLAHLHQLDGDSLTSGALTTWESNYIGPSPKTMTGSTLFGVSGELLYRDRGFSTHKPITAKFYMRDPKTMCLRTEYSSNIYEEEIRLVGSQYRTRQTIISRAGEEQMIGQYLETRTK